MHENGYQPQTLLGVQPKKSPAHQLSSVPRESHPAQFHEPMFSLGGDNAGDLKYSMTEAVRFSLTA